MRNLPSSFKKLSAALLCGGTSLLLTACGGGAYLVADSAPVYKPVRVTLAHINDQHSQLDAFANTELRLDGVPTQIDMGGFARVTAAFRAYDGRKDVIKLHAGDATTGTLYYTLFKGKADAEMMNTICFDAFVPGNHEFDDGDAQLRSFIDALHSGSCKTPVVAANIQPAAGTPLAGVLKPYTIKEIEGVKIAIIGLDTKNKVLESSRPLPSTVLEDEAVAAQRTIDKLKTQGIRHIVLLTHIGYAKDKALATRLTDVDAIIGGDSHSLLGDFAELGLSSSGAYPTRVSNKDGDPVCIGQAWEYSKAIGEMQLSMNERGAVESCQGQASLLLGGTFKRQNVAKEWVDMDAAAQEQLAQKLVAQGNVKVLAPDAQASALLADYKKQVDVKKAQVIGTNAAPLCLVRTPGESTNRSGGVAGCEKANTQAKGSDVAQVVAEAFLHGSLAANIAIQNAGGVRIPMASGPLTLNDVFKVLPFSNVLVELRLSGQQIKDTLEETVASYLDAKQSNAAHPYAAGLRWDLDMSRKAGERFSNLQVRNRKTGEWQPLDRAQTYTVVTNDFIASGKDGYATFGKVYAKGDYVNNYLLYSQTLVDYVQAKKTLQPIERVNYSHQTVITAQGQRLP